MNEQPVITEKLKNVKLSDDIVLSIDISQVGNVKTVNGIEPISGDIHLPVDSAISYESENPIQNKAVSLKMKDDQDLYFDILERNTGLIFIKDVEDLLKLKQYVDDGEETSAKYYLQVRDIDLSGIAWEGIGLYADGGANMRQFRGTYNGGGYKIRNQKFKTPCDDVGFFNCAANGAAIKNMEIHLDGIGFDIGDLSVNSNYKTKAELDAENAKDPLKDETELTNGKSNIDKATTFDDIEKAFKADVKKHIDDIKEKAKEKLESIIDGIFDEKINQFYKNSVKFILISEL